MYNNRKYGKTSETIWFEGSNQINCEIKDIKDSFDNMGMHFTDVIKLMPGMKEVELIEQGNDYVTIKTNEGLMKRTNISINVEKEKITMEFDEEYKAGKTITTHSHLLDEFSASNA